MTPFLQWDGAELDGAIWQGIRYAAIDFTVPGFAAVVTVHLARAAGGLTDADVEIGGGRSIVDLPYEIALVNGATSFTVSFPERGDHSNYFVRLRTGGNDPLHPFFSSAEFNFYIECPAGDCRPGTLTATPPPEPYPAVDLRNKDFRAFVRMLSEWVKVTNPNWADLAPASFERVLIELLSHHADMLSYYQDRVANEAFIGSARERFSMRQHATLLGYELFDGLAASTTLAFDVTNSGFVPDGLEVQASRLPDESPVVFFIPARTRVEAENNSTGLIPAAWPQATTAAIPVGATSMLLWDHGTRLAPGLRIAFTQGAASQIVTLAEVAEIALPGWVQSPADPPNAVNQNVTQIAWSEPLLLPYRPWLAPEFRLHGNLVDARHGELRRARVESPAAPLPGEIVIELNRRNSIVAPLQLGTGAPIPLLRALEVPEGPVLFDSSGPVMTVEIGGEEWTRQTHLHNSQSYDLHYVATADENGRVWLQFGDGTRGREVRIDLATGSTELPIRITYRVGDPVAGNCSRDTLTVIVPPPAGTSIEAELADLGATTVTNVVPGAGGRRPESIDAAREAAPASLRHGPLQRAVALQDYADVARQLPEVARAAAKAIDGIFNTVIVLVDPKDQTDLSEELRQRVFDHIDRLRMAGREHFVARPVYVPLTVVLALCVEPGFLRHEVRDRVLAELRPGSGDRRGYFHPDELNFGQDVEVGELLAFVQSIAGVRAVKALEFRRSDTPDPAVVDRIDLALTEVGRLDADEDFPENGVLLVQVVGLDLPAELEDDFAVDGPAPEIGVGP
jgi:hypothetical protein